jgi:Fe-S cluster assembly iron-binding protein IscA
MLALTNSATEAIESILSAPGLPDGAGIRIAATAPESGEAMATSLRVSVAEAPDEHDQVIEEQGARVFVDDAVVDYLDHKLLDVAVGGDGVAFAIDDQTQ